MKRHSFLFGMAVALCAGFVLAAMESRAQGRAATGGRTAASIVKILDVGGDGPRGLVDTPDYSNTVMHGKGRPGRWAQIIALYETDRNGESEWIDELTLQFYALCYNKQTSKYTMFKGTLAHTDLPMGRHMSAMYLRPHTLQRYGEVVAVAVEVLYNGELAATKSEEVPNQRTKLPAEWWNKAGDQVAIKEGYLVHRMETPFAFVNYDDFEHAK